MARTVRDTILDSRSARLRLPEAKKHWRQLELALHMGYRRGPRGGTWYARRFSSGRYIETTLGPADDRTDADGQTVLSYRHALDAARNWWQVSERKERGLPEPDAGPYTVDTACDDYLVHYATKGGKSEYTIRRAIEVHIRPVFGSLLVEDLTTKAIRSWHRGLATAPKIVRTKSKATERATRAVDLTDPEIARSRRATANRVLTVLKSILNLAWHDKHVATDDEWRPVKPFENVESAVVRYLTAAECQRLVNTCPPDLRRIVRAALVTGARYGELCRLKVGDVNLDAGIITIRESKSGKPRHAVLTSEGVSVFEELVVGKAKGDLVFIREDGEPWKQANQTRPLAYACRRVGISPVIGFHVLRHTHASTLAMAGVPMAVIAQQLGHADTRITEKHYAHLAPSYVADTIRASFPSLGIVEQTNVKRVANER